MNYCSRCVVPYTRPGIRFDAHGNCNCAKASDKDAIDWEERERLFKAVVDNAKARSSGGYDCIIPVSGGKDSTWQVAMCLKYGLRPLCVTWRPPGRTSVGQKNLENLIQMGVDHIDYSISPAVEKKFTLLAYERFGSTAIPMHMAIFAIPLMVAARFRVPLIIWGENSAFEYGGEEEQRTGFKLDRKWLARHGVTHGTTARDWVGAELSEKDLAPYFGPSDEDLEAAGTTAVFLGYYFRWDPQVTYEIAKRHGFVAGGEARTGIYDFADIDDDFVSLHHWLKWYKFGFTRSFDNLSLEIRNGRMTRENALVQLRKRGDETPHADIEKFCSWVGITRERFFAIAETFRDPEVWKKSDGEWKIPGFILPDWKWSGDPVATNALQAYSDRFETLLGRCHKLVDAGQAYAAVVIAHELYRYIYPHEPVVRFTHEDPIPFTLQLVDRLIGLADATLDSVVGYRDLALDAVTADELSLETRTSSLYSDLWRAFGGETMQRESLELLRNRIPADLLEHHVRGKKVLDVGCGSGRYTLALAAAGADVTGIDYQGRAFARANEIARENGLRATFIEGNVLELPFADESFDFVFCNGVLHHTADMERGLDEYVRVMRKGGAGFLYLYGTGGVFWHTRKRMRELFEKIPYAYTQRVFDVMGVPGNRFVFCDTWYVPVERHTTRDHLERMLEERGATFLKLVSKNLIDLDCAVERGVKDAAVMWGDGDHRYLVQRRPDQG